MEQGTSKRERLASRLGFLLLTAGCAIGLGNVWRFPYIAGKYGGALFLLIYLFFLLVLGFPIMVSELSLGRAAQSDLAGAYKTLSNKKTSGFWSVFGNVCFIGNFLLLMFYSVITGWMLAYFYHFLVHGLDTSVDTAALFGQFVGNWREMLVFDFVAIILSVLVCAFGVQKGIEKSMKIMLGGLFVLELLLIILVSRNKGAGDGFSFLLMPSYANMTSEGIWAAVHAAMMQAFFTLSLGIGSIAICGSYIGKERSLAGESLLIILLDTLAAMLAAMIIFPGCFAFGIKPDAGPSLVFITLPRVFQEAPMGHFLGVLFFLFMSVAALSTLIAVAENLIAYFMRVLKTSRIKSSILVGVALMILSLPCLFGFNLWSSFQPFGAGTNVLDLEDFLVSDNLLPLGSLAIVIFCTSKLGWGKEKFREEADAGKGLHMPKFAIIYMKYVLPLIIFGLWLHNIITKFAK